MSTNISNYQEHIEELVQDFNDSQDFNKKLDIRRKIVEAFRLQRKWALYNKGRLDYFIGSMADNVKY